MRRTIACWAVPVVALAAGATGGFPQDYTWLRINEVIADNATVTPLDVAGNATDMIEIYNPTDSFVYLGTFDATDSLALTDSLELPHDDPSTPLTEPGPYIFRAGLRILPSTSVVVFCDENPVQNLCEPHADFRISSRGDEPITLWGPVIGYEDDGRPVREVIDQVWLPPLREDTSFGRYPDGAGPAPVPLEEVLSTFVFNPPATSTFGTCVNVTNTCPSGNARRCFGAANGAGGNVRPRVEIIDRSTNRPAAGEPVALRVKVEDEKGPLPGNIASVQIVYRVDGGPERRVDLAYDAAVGLRHAPLVDELGNPVSAGPGSVPGESPFDIRTEWTGEIPGQPAGSRVEFYLWCQDAEGAEDSSPQRLCPDGIGPCDLEFGGPGCARDSEDAVQCEVEDGDEVSFVGVRYSSCSRPFTYVSGYEVRTAVRGLVIDEVIASQERLLRDPSEANDICDWNEPTCKYDDLVELHNSSGRTIDLSGLWLSASRFNPRGWRFPEGAAIDAGERLIVWLDGDGGKCPCPTETPPDAVYCQRESDQQPCFWRCPDPTDVATKSYHASFALDADRDQLYLHDREDEGLGVIDAVEFEALGVDCSLSRISDGAGGACWVRTCAGGTEFPPTPGAQNAASCPAPGREFLRGDSNADCRVDISDALFTLGYLFLGGAAPGCADAADADDSGSLEITGAIFLLGYLFLGGQAPPAPGPSGPPGPDPTSDDLGCDVYPPCG